MSLRNNLSMQARHFITNSQLLFLLLILSLNALFTANAAEQTLNPDTFHTKLSAYQSLVEETLVWRTKAVAFIEELKSESLYNSEQLIIIHNKGTNNYKRLREQLLAFAKEYEWITDRDTGVRLTENKSRIIEQDPWRKPFDSSRKIAEVNPTETIGQLHIKGAKLSLASALLLYDNYFVAIEQYQQVDKLRHIINADNAKTTHYLDKVNTSFTEVEHYERTAKAVRLINQELKWERKNPESQLAQDQDNLYLNQLIQGSYSYKKINDISVFDVHKSRIQIFAKRIHDTIRGIAKTTTNEISKIFGNGVGIIATRQGKLFSLPKEERQAIADNLKPLDILLEKTPFRLTDKFIPGHWGHVALWVGTKQELQNLGVWQELPRLYQHAVATYGYRGPDFQQAINSGHNIIEALRPGVKINNLAHFLNIDDLAVLRYGNLSPAQQKSYLIRAIQQIGKDYDFNFDVETDRTIVCSELAYVVYNDPTLDWPTDKALGRYTISPDHIANKAKPGKPFYPVLLYHDGQEIKNNLEQNFVHLLEQNYQRISY